MITEYFEKGSLFDFLHKKKLKTNRTVGEFRDKISNEPEHSTLQEIHIA